MSYTQLLVGSGSSFFSILFSKYKKWLNHNRLTSLWEFTDKIQLQLTIKREWIPTLPRERDIFLMDYFVRQQYKSSDLKLLNQCRLYLQVLSLTDICSADGANIVTPICNGLKLVDRRSTLHWPEQERPSKVAWNLWRVATEHLAGDSIHRWPLGNWLHTPHQQWFWYMDPTISVLFHNPTPDNCLQQNPLYHNTHRPTRSSIKPSYNISESTRV